MLGAARASGPSLPLEYTDSTLATAQCPRVITNYRFVRLRAHITRERRRPLGHAVTQKIVEFLAVWAAYSCFYVGALSGPPPASDLSRVKAITPVSLRIFESSTMAT